MQSRVLNGVCTEYTNHPRSTFSCKRCKDAQNTIHRLNQEACYVSEPRLIGQDMMYQCEVHIDHVDQVARFAPYLDQDYCTDRIHDYIHTISLRTYVDHHATRQPDSQAGVARLSHRAPRWGSKATTNPVLLYRHEPLIVLGVVEGKIGV